MQYIKTTLKRTGGDLTIKIPLSVDEQLNGLQQPIDDFIERETGLSINPVEDKDTFRYSPINTVNMDVYFYSGVTYDNTYEAAGFTSEEIVLRDEVILRSFYLMQVYDSVKTSNQILLHNGYFTGYNFLNVSGTGSTDYSYGNKIEFSDLYMPNWYITSLSGATTTLYGKITFYNSKTGKLQLFSQTSTPPTGDTDMYFEISLSASTFSYDMPDILPYELPISTYTDKINDTVDSFDNLKPAYPTGDTFLNTGKYIN